MIDKYEPEFFQREICLKFAENPRGATAFADLQIKPPPTERAFINLWKLYILVLIGEHFQEYGSQSKAGKEVLEALTSSKLLPVEHSLKVILGKVRNYIAKYFNPISLEPNIQFSEAIGTPKGIGLKITFNEPSERLAEEGIKSVDTLFIKANEELQESSFKIWFLLDRLDNAFTESPQLEENALRALFKTYLDLRGYNCIELKIFLRSDIWQSITKKGFRESTHITKCTTIDWNRPSLLNLIIQRFLNNRSIIDFYRISAKKILSSFAEQEKLFYRMCPRKVDIGKNPDTLDWIIGRTRDSSGLSTPREIINLIREALRFQIKSIEIGQNEPENEMLFTRAALKKGLEFASREKTEKYLFAEHPNLRKYFNLLRGGKARYSIKALMKVWKCSEKEALKAAEQILETGFWRKEKKEPPEFWIEFIFRDGLDIIQGKAEE